MYLKTSIQISLTEIDILNTTYIPRRICISLLLTVLAYSDISQDVSKQAAVSIICELSAVDTTYRETIMLLAHRVRKILWC